jgi:hypothetical protein
MRLDHVLQLTDNRHGVAEWEVEALEERQPGWICWPNCGSYMSPSDTCNAKWTRTGNNLWYCGYQAQHHWHKWCNKGYVVGDIAVIEPQKGNRGKNLASGPQNFPFLQSLSSLEPLLDPPLSYHAIFRSISLLTFIINRTWQHGRTKPSVIRLHNFEP